MKAKVDAPFVPLNIAVLTVSDTRTLETDTSGQVFVDRLSEAGHQLAARVLLKDDLYKIRAQVAHLDRRRQRAGGADHRRHRVSPAVTAHQKR